MRVKELARLKEILSYLTNGKHNQPDTSCALYICNPKVFGSLALIRIVNKYLVYT
jgi:hypothetical protein